MLEDDLLLVIRLERVRALTIPPWDKPQIYVRAYQKSSRRD